MVTSMVALDMYGHWYEYGLWVVVVTTFLLEDFRQDASCQEGAEFLVTVAVFLVVVMVVSCRLVEVECEE